MGTEFTNQQQKEIWKIHKYVEIKQCSLDQGPKRGSGVRQYSVEWPWKQHTEAVGSEKAAANACSREEGNLKSLSSLYNLEESEKEQTEPKAAQEEIVKVWVEINAIEKRGKTIWNQQPKIKQNWQSLS